MPDQQFPDPRRFVSDRISGLIRQGFTDNCNNVLRNRSYDISMNKLDRKVGHKEKRAVSLNLKMMFQMQKFIKQLEWMNQAILQSCSREEQENIKHENRQLQRRVSQQDRFVTSHDFEYNQILNQDSKDSSLICVPSLQLSLSQYNESILMSKQLAQMASTELLQADLAAQKKLLKDQMLSYRRRSKSMIVKSDSIECKFGRGKSNPTSSHKQKKKVRHIKTSSYISQMQVKRQISEFYDQRSFQAAINRNSPVKDPNFMNKSMTFSLLHREREIKNHSQNDQSEQINSQVNQSRNLSHIDLWGYNNKIQKNINRAKKHGFIHMKKMNQYLREEKNIQEDKMNHQFKRPTKHLTNQKLVQEIRKSISVSHLSVSKSSKPSSNQRDDLVVQLQQQNESLKKQLNANRIFLNMVIHDMRNPTTSIQFGIQECLSLLQQRSEEINALRNHIMSQYRKSEVKDLEYFSLKDHKKLLSKGRQVERGNANKKHLFKQEEEKKQSFQSTDQNSGCVNQLDEIRIRNLKNHGNIKSSFINIFDRVRIQQSVDRCNDKDESSSFSIEKSRRELSHIKLQDQRNQDMQLKQQKFEFNQADQHNNQKSDSDSSQIEIFDTNSREFSEELYKDLDKQEKLRTKEVNQSCFQKNCDKNKCHVVFIDRFIPIKPQLTLQMDRSTQTQFDEIQSPMNLNQNLSPPNQQNDNRELNNELQNNSQKNQRQQQVNLRDVKQDEKVDRPQNDNQCSKQNISKPQFAEALDLNERKLSESKLQEEMRESQNISSGNEIRENVLVPEVDSKVRQQVEEEKNQSIQPKVDLRKRKERIRPKIVQYNSFRQKKVLPKNGILSLSSNSIAQKKMLKGNSKKNLAQQYIQNNKNQGPNSIKSLQQFGPNAFMSPQTLMEPYTESAKIDELNILDRELTNRMEKLLQNTIFSSRMLNNLINDLLDLAKFEKQTFTFNEEYFNLLSVIESAFEQVKFLSDQKNIQLDYVFGDSPDLTSSSSSLDQIVSSAVNVQKPLNFYRPGSDDDRTLLSNIYGDPRRYLQIILNFLSNALKFTHNNGKITIYLKVIDQQDIQVMNDQEKKEERKNFRKNIKHINKELCQSSFNTPRKKTESDGCQFPKVSPKRKQTVNDLFWTQLSDRNLNVQRNSNERNRETSSVSVDHNQNQQKFVKFILQINDTGVGIKKENLGKLFMDFSKLDEHSKLNAQGTGLGLSICKNMIEKMGGQVSVQSQINKGTTFTVELSTKSKLPQAKDAQSHESSEGPKPQDQMQINSNLQSRSGQSDHSISFTFQNGEGEQHSSPHLKNENMSVANIGESNSGYANFIINNNLQNIFANLQSNNSQDQIEEQKVSTPSNRYIDGNNSLRKNSQKSQFNSARKNLSNSKRQESESFEFERSKYSGRKQHIDEIEQIKECIYSHFDSQEEQESGEYEYEENMLDEESEIPEKIYRCLIANDDNFQLMAMNYNLELLGIQVVEAVNGLEAYQKCVNDIDNFDFIILDLDMPIMNGFDAYKKIMQHYDPDQKFFKRVTIGGSPKRGNSENSLNKDKMNEGRVSGAIPYMFAITGFVTEAIQLEAKKCGFLDVIDAPLTTIKIQEKIIARIEKEDFGKDISKVSQPIIQMVKEEENEQESQESPKHQMKIPVNKKRSQFYNQSKEDEYMDESD